MEKFDNIIGLWQSFNITTKAELDKHLHDFRILFAYHSGKIENDEINFHDTREIFENNRVTGFTGSPRALFEQKNQKLCYEMLTEEIVRRKPLSLDLIRDIHNVLTSGTYVESRYIENSERPGEFKKHDYVTGIHQVGSASKNVERDLMALVSEINTYEGKDVFKAAAYLHARFEFIHPFADGNGRVGRTLMNYYLLIHNHPPLIIYEEDKRLYYECLQQYDEAEEITSLYQFLRYETEKTWQNTLSLSEGNNQVHKGLSDY